MPQLHEDLVALRTQKQLSVQDVHDRTRITIYNIEQLESGMMFESDRNPTYIRNFARTYGKSLGISLSDMSKALDMMNEGNYDGFLARKYAPDESSTPPPGEKAAEQQKEQAPKEEPAKQKPKEAPASGKAEASEDSTTAENQGKEVPPSQKQDASAPKQSKAPSSAKAKPKSGKIGQTSSGTAQMKSGPAPQKEKADKKEQKPARRVLDGSSIKPGYGVVGSKKPGARDVNWSKLRQDAEKPKSGLSIQLIAGIVAIVLLLAALTYWLTLPEDDFAPDASPQLEAQTNQVPLPDEDDEPELESSQDTTDPLSSDTLDAPVPPDPSMTNIALADTMQVVVFAATGNLAPFRVESDTFEQRRPYWVEQGQGMRIKFIDEMRLSFNLSDMLVLYDGRVLNTFDETSTNTELVITRSLFENAEGLEAITDEAFPEGVEPPRIINDRPVME